MHDDEELLPSTEGCRFLTIPLSNNRPRGTSGLSTIGLKLQHTDKLNTISRSKVEALQPAVPAQYQQTVSCPRTYHVP
jgi:hypothetical protein